MTFRSPAELSYRVNGAGVSRASADWRLDAARTRAWPDMDLWVLVSGDVTFYAAGQSLPLRPGSCLLMQGGQDYEIARTSSRPLVNYWVHFDYIDPATRTVVPHPTVELPWQERSAEAGSLVFPLFDRLRSAERGDEAARWLAALLLEIEAQPSHAEESGASTRPTWLAAFCRQVRDAPERPHSVADLARRTGYDPAYICRVFTRHTGMSPKQFITQTRIRAAQALLRDSAMSIASIAAAVGYRDAHFFSRHFRVVTGVSASAYRG